MKKTVVSRGVSEGLGLRVWGWGVGLRVECFGLGLFRASELLGSQCLGFLRALLFKEPVVDAQDPEC